MVKSRRENNILSLSWPIFIELVLQMLVGNADQIMVGWYNHDLVGAIGNANQIVNLLLIVTCAVYASERSFAPLRLYLYRSTSERKVRTDCARPTQFRSWRTSSSGWS